MLSFLLSTLQQGHRSLRDVNTAALVWDFSKGSLIEFSGSRIRPLSGYNFRHVLIYSEGCSCFNWQLDLCFLATEDVVTRINGTTGLGYNF